MYGYNFFGLNDHMHEPENTMQHIASQPKQEWIKNRNLKHNKITRLIYVNF